LLRVFWWGCCPWYASQKVIIVTNSSSTDVSDWKLLHLGRRRDVFAVILSSSESTVATLHPFTRNNKYHQQCLFLLVLCCCCCCCGCGLWVVAC
jgi:hypothetical protein